MPFREPSAEADRLAHEVIGAAITVHKTLGPGYLHTIYDQALQVELAERRLPFAHAVTRAVMYRDTVVGEHQIDLIVDDKLIVVVRAARGIESIDVVQTLSYLRATTIELGLIINFNAGLLREGIRRVVFTHAPEPPEPRFSRGTQM